MNHLDLPTIRENFNQVNKTLLILKELDDNSRINLYNSSKNSHMNDMLLEQYQGFIKLVIDECESTQSEPVEVSRLLGAYQEVIEDLINFLRVEPQDEVSRQMQSGYLILEAYRR